VTTDEHYRRDESTTSLIYTALETNLFELHSFSYIDKTASEEPGNEDAKLFKLFQALKYLKTCLGTSCVP